MDPEKAKRRQSLKILISESIMVLAVVVTVVVLAFLVSGYWLNSDFKIERNGLLQISSVPTGADVYIDGESAWLQRTNTSKILSSGEHNIKLTKDGYDTWSKTINISEGLLYRIHYPRLFLQNRSSQKVFDAANYTLSTISPDHNSLILINNTTKWEIINLSNETIKPEKLDISTIFPSISMADSADTGLFTGVILNIDWDQDSSHALFKVQSSEEIEWILLDVKDPSRSINLTREFGSNFTEVQIIDNNSSSLLAIQNNNLHKIDVPSRSLSAVIINNIINFDHYNAEIIFSARNDSSSNMPYYIGLLRLGDNKINTITNTSTPTKVVLSKFYDDKYITILQDSQVSLYKKDNFELIQTFSLNFTPDTIKVGHDGEFIIMSTDNQIAALDMEAISVVEWQAEGSHFGWIDNDMLYSVNDGNLIVYDFDGLNRRIIASNVSSHFPAAITNNKWLYYFSDGSLIREIISN